MARILIVGKYYPPFLGGIEDNTAAIAQALSRGHDVTALVNAHDGASEGDEVVEGVRVLRRRPLLTVSNQPIAPHLFKGVDPKRFDIVHFHAPNPFASALLLGGLGPGPAPRLYITHHMDIMGRPGLRQGAQLLYKSLVRRASGVIVTSLKNARMSNDLPRWAPVIAIPSGVSPERYLMSAHEQEAAIAWRRALAGDHPLVGFLGRHARYKGLDILVRALKLAPGVHAVIAGDGPYRARAQALALKLGVAERAHFIGSVDHATKLKVLSAIDVFTFPSTEVTEALGISQAEAMLCGAPVVASDLPTGVTDIAIDGQTALLCRPSDARDLAGKLQTLLADRAFAERLGRQGRAHVLATMAQDIVQSKTCDVLTGAIQARVLADA